MNIRRVRLLRRGSCRSRDEPQSLPGAFDAPTVADICLAGQVIAATSYFNCDVSGVPTALRIYGECMKLDAFAKAHPSKQAEAPKSLVTP